MLSEISNIEGGRGQALLDSQSNLLYVLVGNPVYAFTWEQMVKIWTFAATEPTFYSCTKCVGCPGKIHDHTLNCHPVLWAWMHG